MKKFSFVVHNENGLDARLAGRLIKETIACQGEVKIQSGEKTGNGKMIFNVLSLHARKGDCIKIELVGGQEDADAQRLMAFVEQHI